MAAAPGATMKVPPWDRHDLVELLRLEPAGAMRWRTRLGDINAHGRAYGGQILAQALMAAAASVPAGRTPTMMQFLFLQGTLHDEAIELQVTALQDGKRFSSRHVRGAQGADRQVFDAQVSFALPLDAPAHGVAPGFVADEDPERLPRPQDLPAGELAAAHRVLGYELPERAMLDFRIPPQPGGLALDPADPHLRFWLRLTQAMPDDEVLHAAAFAYLSDWWLNYPAPGAHLRELDGRGRLYVASLNHAIWLHHPVRVDRWLHFDSRSPAAAGGRGLSVARVHDRAGRLVASATQECLMALRDG